MTDPLSGTPWSDAGTVAGFVQSPPNQTLIDFAAAELAAGRTRALDIGCGAGRNAIPLALQGWTVMGLDLSMAMLVAAHQRSAKELSERRLHLALAPMERLPIASRSVDLVIAHGIWNLATSTAQFRASIREAARVARPGAALFVFTFSRGTLPPGDEPVAGEEFVFTGFSGGRQCFLTAGQLIAELEAAGFLTDSAVPLTEHNRRPPGVLRAGGPPVIYEGTFRLVG